MAEVTDIRVGGPVGAEVGAVALEGWVGEEGRVGGGEVVKVVRIGEGLDEFELEGESAFGREWTGEEGSSSGSGGRGEGEGRGEGLPGEAGVLVGVAGEGGVGGGVGHCEAR